MFLDSDWSENTNLLVEDIEHLLPVMSSLVKFRSEGKSNNYVSAILIQTERSSLFSDRLKNALLNLDRGCCVLAIEEDDVPINE